MEFNDAFFENLSRSPAVTGLVVAAAEKVAAAARASAPVESGAYRAGIVVRTKYQRRTVALVVATDPKSMLLESQTGNLARALNSVKRGA